MAVLTGIVASPGTDISAATDALFSNSPKSTMLLTRVDPRTKDAADMLAFLAEQQLTVLPTKVCERVAFRRAIGEGAIVHEIGRDQVAISEMDAFFQEATT